MLLNTDSELLSAKDIKKSESRISSTESLKESLPKLSQLSTKHTHPQAQQAQQQAQQRNTTLSGVTAGSSELSSKQGGGVRPQNALVKRIGEQLLKKSNFH